MPSASKSFSLLGWWASWQFFLAVMTQKFSFGFLLVTYCMCHQHICNNKNLKKSLFPIKTCSLSSKKKPYYKLKLASFAHEKTCQYFSEKLSGLYLFITLAKPTKDKTKIFVSHTLQKLKKKWYRRNHEVFI